MDAVKEQPSQRAGPGSETLEQLTARRLQAGLAPPREIYDVRNRGRIDWSHVPIWAIAPDPEIFEGAHEG